MGDATDMKPSGSPCECARHNALVERLDRIEVLLGKLSLHGLDKETAGTIMEAWWEARHEVKRADDLRRLSLKEFGRV